MGRSPVFWQPFTKISWAGMQLVAAYWAGFAWAWFLVLLRKSGNQANYQFFLKVLVRRMIVYTACNPLNFLWAPFSLNEPPNLLDYYKFDCRKSENMKIRRPDWSGSCLIGQVAVWSKSGSCMIDQATAWSKSGSCLIDQAAEMVKSGSCMIDQAAAWSIRTLVYEKSTWSNPPLRGPYIGLTLL